MSDKPKSVLDVLAWCQDLEQRLKCIEEDAIKIVAHGEVMETNHETLKNGSGERQVKKHISFQKALTAVPTIYTAISGLDTDSDFNTRIEVHALDVTRNGFNLIIRTWGPSNVPFVKAAWFAIIDQNHEN